MSKPRSPKGSSLRLQRRDVELLCDLFLFGVMLRGQIERRYFGSTGRCNARLLKLNTAEYVRRLPLPMPTGASAAGSPFAYALGPTGVRVVASELGWEESEVRSRFRHGTPSHINHTVEVVEVWLNLEASIAGQSLLELSDFLPETLIRHSYEYQLPSGARRQEAFKPDAYALLRRSDTSAPLHLYIEVDLGHTSAQEFVHKLQIAERYLRFGLFAKTHADGDPTVSFRTLYLTTTPVRRDHLIDIARKSQLRNCWFATLPDSRERGLVADIWHDPDGGEPRRLEEA